MVNNGRGRMGMNRQPMEERCFGWIGERGGGVSWENESTGGYWVNPYPLRYLLEEC